MSDSVQSQSGPVYRSVVVEYRDGEQIIDVSPGSPLPVTGSVSISGSTPGLPEADPLPVFQPVSQGAFGDQLVANLSQEISLMFNYHVDSDLVYTLTQGSSSIGVTNSKMVVATGTTSNSLAVAKSKNYLRYRPGYGGLVRFTLGVTTGVSGTEQTAGVGNEEDGFFFSYRDHEDVLGMCIVRRYFGAREIRDLTVTGGSTSAGNVTITLDGVAFTVAVSNNGAGATNQTATNIATNFSSSEWTAVAKGDVVSFRSVRAVAKSGSYSFSAGSTGSTASIAQKVAGAAASEEVIPSQSWNYDKADGTGTLPNLTWSNGNIFQIKYQWLGFGMIQFFIEDPTLGRFIRVHAIEYANTSTSPTVGNPTFPFFFLADNKSTSSNISMFTASCGGFVEGSTTRITGGNTKTYTVADSCDTGGTLLATLWNPNNFKSKNSRIQVSILDISASSAEAITIRFYKNAALTGNASWTSIGANSSMFYDESSTSFTGGELASAMRLEHQTVNTLEAADVSSGVLTLHPDDTLSIVATSDNGTVKLGVTINWVEYL